MAADPAGILAVLKPVLFILLLLAASISDIRSRTIPYAVCVLIALTGLINFSPARLWGLLLAIPFFIASGYKRGGAGDCYLVGASSVVLGLECGAVSLIIGMTAFCLFYLAVHVTNKLKEHMEIQNSYPLAPFLSIGFLATTILNGGIPK